MGDELIIKYIKNKNEKGINLLVDSYGSLINVIVKKYLAELGYHYKEECISDIILSIWNNIKSFDSSKNNFKNWIGAISKYKALDYKKKYYKLSFNEDIENFFIKSENLVEDNIIKEDFKNEVLALLNNLKEDDKKLFIRYYFNEESLDEISNDLSVDKNTLYNRLSRGRKKIKNCFNNVF